MNYLICNDCPCRAVWLYMPGKEHYCYCDIHIKRGCSCNIDPDSGVEDTDQFGRLMPCCEYTYNEDGFIEEDWIG